MKGRKWPWHWVDINGETSMTTLLGIETSTDACSVALDPGGTIREDHRVEPRRHNTLVLGMIDGLLDAAQMKVSDLDGLAFGCGPGSFTGLRIAAGITQGLSLAQSLPVIPVSTLEVLAATALTGSAAAGAVGVIRARPGEYYIGCYARQDEALVALAPDQMVSAADWRLPAFAERDWILAGDIVELVEDPSMDLDSAGLLKDLCLQAISRPKVRPRAAVLVEIAGRYLAQPVAHVERAVAADKALPVYLQRELPWRKLDG